MSEANVRVILIVTGAVTLAAGAGLAMPRPLFRILFGIDLGNATSVLIARHWSLLIALVGGMLVYAAGHPEARVPILIAAATEKLVLGFLVVFSPLHRRGLTVAIVGADIVMALFYVGILWNLR